MLKYICQQWLSRFIRQAVTNNLLPTDRSPEQCAQTFDPHFTLLNIILYSAQIVR